MLVEIKKMEKRRGNGCSELRCSGDVWKRTQKSVARYSRIRVQ